ncbi:MAG: rhomboid family intramembrane serine protease [Hyphomicrobium sp.]
MTVMPRRQPIFNAPAIVLALLAAFIAVHVVRSQLSDDNDIWTVLALAFIPARYAGMASALPGGEIAKYTSFVSHAFVHADITHLAINSAWLLAFGSVIAKRIGAVRFLLFSAVSAIAGAALFLAMHWGLVAPVVGASGAVAGLMGGAMRFIFRAIDEGRGWQLREQPSAIPLMSLRECLTDRRIVLASAVFVGLNVLALIGFGAFGTGGSIAWEAHLGGYFFGLLAFGAFDVAPQHLTMDPANVE